MWRMGRHNKRTIEDKQKCEAKRNPRFLRWEYDCRCRPKDVRLCTIHYIAVKTKTPNSSFVVSGKCLYECVWRQFIFRLHWHFMWMKLLENLTFVEQLLENTNLVRVFFSLMHSFPTVWRFFAGTYNFI